jgi:hypothetical protein
MPIVKKSIVLKTFGGVIREEAIANAILTPGHLVELLSTGKIQKHGTAGGSAVERAFAVEDELQGKTIRDNYAANSRVQYNIFRSGDNVLAILADGENVVVGDKLESAGAGTLRKVVADTSAGTIKVQSVIAVALEAVDMSGSSGVDPSGRIAVRII